MACVLCLDAAGAGALIAGPCGHHVAHAACLARWRDGCPECAGLSRAAPPEERWELLSRGEGARRAAEPAYVDMPELPCPRRTLAGGECGSTRRVCIRQVQLRAADELASTFYRCDAGHIVRYN